MASPRAYKDPRPTPAPTEQLHQVTREWLEDLFSQAKGQRFYGQLTFYLDAGNIVRAERLESMRPPSSPPEAKISLALVKPPSQPAS